MPKLPIIYASTSGNVQATCERVSELLNNAGIETELHRAESTSYSVINNHPIILFATSTWEHGEINPFFKPLLAEISKAPLSNRRAGFIGLGDRRYEEVYFCNGVEILKNAWVSAGGVQIGTTLKIDGEPYKLMNSVIKDWTGQFLNVLKGQNTFVLKGI